MATSTSTVPGTDQAEPALRTGAGLMTLAAVAFIGYGGIFTVRNFSNSFLELGIGPAQVDVGKAQIQAFSPSLAHYISHLHLALAGFVAATGLAVAVLSWFGCAGATCGPGSARSPRRCSPWPWPCPPTTPTTSTPSGTWV